MPASGERLNLSGLTDQQHRAVTARGVSVAVSAGAGCGKTLVLTERFLAELEPDGVPGGRRSRLGQLVAITFTERAAREMRDRIRKACRKRLEECPEPQADYWLQLIRDLDSARISTIHSFCASLLRAHAVEAGLDPRFRVLDGAQAGTLLFELTDDLLRERLADRDDDALTLVTRFGVDRLRTMISRLLEARQKIDWPAWRSETPEDLLNRWHDYWRTKAVPRALRRLSESPAARTVLDLANRYPPSHPTMRERCDFLREAIPAIGRMDLSAASGEGVGMSVAEARNVESARSLLTAMRDNAKVQGGGTKKHWVSEDIYERFRDAAKALREAIDRLGGCLQFDLTAARPAAVLGLQVLKLAADLAEQYEAKKRELGVLDFNDLLIRAGSLLTDVRRESLRKRLASQIRLLLVDESQDTDELQVEMVKSLCDNEYLDGKLFFVGDHKQSIYRFRGAQPEVFRGLHGQIPDGGRLALSLNFRSQPGVLDFVNALFCEELGPDYEPLRAARAAMGSEPAIEFLWAHDAVAGDNSVADRAPPAHVADDSAGPREQLRRREADWIARRIRHMIDIEKRLVWDKDAKQERPVQAGDIAILFRALSNVEYYEDALQRHGVDYYLVGGHAFYAQQEIYDLLNLLRAINSAADEVSLAGVLRSPMFSLHDETLLWLSRSDGQEGKGLAAGLFASPLPDQIDDEQRRRASFAAATLGELRTLKDRLPVAELIETAIERTGYDALLVAEFLGERKLANLHKLIDQARSFDQAGVFTLSDFITQLAEFVARQPDEPLAATCPEAADVVRLMTIHQAKGLEFPVVVVADVGRPRRLMWPPVAFAPELGPVLKDGEATTGYDLLMAAENDEEQEELKRLFYVAATRAADYLILSAGVDEPGTVTGPWMELLGRRFDLLTGRLQEADGVDQPSAPALVKVTTSAPPADGKAMVRPQRDLLKIVQTATNMAKAGQGQRPPLLAPVAADPTARRQYSFSRLTGKVHAPGDRETHPWDGDSSDAPLDPRGLGTLTHAVLAQVDFGQPESVAELVDQLAEEHLPRQEKRWDEPIEMIERFVRSPRGAEIAAAKQVHRELEFLLAWPPLPSHKAGDGTKNDIEMPGRYLQGFIDCLYQEAEGRWKLIDYKTNRVTADSLADVAAKYEMQMLVYALAAETVLGQPPAELTLCFIRPGLESHLVWDAAARQRVVDMVSAALP
ncbi:MAG: UvrD-helicase domain-containing protein [Thermoguttaceae bacterium]